MMKKLRLPLILLLGAMPGSLFSQQERPSVGQQEHADHRTLEVRPLAVDENVSYGFVNGYELRMDVYKPVSDAGIHAAVILIHGGGWTSLDKSTMHGMGEFLARFGYTAFAVDYRLLQGTRNRWPAQLDDVQRAVRWIRANAAIYHISPEHIGAFGHSAGAQLAALLGMRETRDNSDPVLASYSSRVQAVVDVSGPTDFTLDRDPDGTQFLTDFLGTEYTKNPQTWREASPALCASRGDAPFLILHGTQDESVPVAQSQELFEKLQAAGVSASFIKADDAHTFRKTESRRLLADKTLDFFDRYLLVTREAK